MVIGSSKTQSQTRKIFNSTRVISELPYFLPYIEEKRRIGIKNEKTSRLYNLKSHIK